MSQEVLAELQRLYLQAEQLRFKHQEAVARFNARLFDVKVAAGLDPNASFELWPKGET